MKIINNQDIRLIDELKKSIQTGSKVYLSSNHFTTFSMFELIDTLSVAKQVSILLSFNPTDVDDFIYQLAVYDSLFVQDDTSNAKPNELLNIRYLPLL
jgi:hypothetical protein